MRKLIKVNKSTVRVRLTAWYVLLLGCTLVLFSSYLYLQLRYSLLGQLDTALEVTASEVLNYCIEQNGTPSFKQTKQFQTISSHLAHAGFAVRLVSSDGKIWDGFGNYQTLPPLVQQKKGYSNLSDRQTIWRVYTQPLRSSSVKSWLQVAQSLQPVFEASQHLLTLINFAFPLVLIVAGLGGIFLADQTLRPIARIIHTAQAIGPSDFSRRISYQGPADEVGRLAMTLDRMLDRIQSAFERERRFIADASHELRTPLTAIKGRIGVTLSRSRTPSEYESTLQDLEREADRLIRLTNGLLFLARLEQEEWEEVQWQFSEVDLSNLLSVLAEQMEPLGATGNIFWEENISPELFINGNCDYLTSLFLNLLDNAIKYTPNGGRVKVEAKQEDARVRVAIANTGKGIPAEHIPHLFERFYRVESARSLSRGGAGLGLAIAYEIARLHGGSIAVDSQPNQITTFTVFLPQLQALKKSI